MTTKIAARRCLLRHSRKSAPTSRSYYSHHHPDPAAFPQAQEKILSAALKRVPEYGFSERALSLGAKDSGYLDVSVQLFPRGVFDLVNYYLVTQRLALKDTVHFPEDSKLGVGRRVKTLTMARLRANKDIIGHWQGVRPPFEYITFMC
jgi:ubiquinone biosynthesis protein COQ9